MLIDFSRLMFLTLPLNLKNLKLRVDVEIGRICLLEVP